MFWLQHETTVAVNDDLLAIGQYGGGVSASHDRWDPVFTGNDGCVGGGRTVIDHHRRGPGEQRSPRRVGSRTDQDFSGQQLFELFWRIDYANASAGPASAGTGAVQ